MLADASQNGEAVVAGQNARLEEGSLLTLSAPIQPLGQTFSATSGEAAVSTAELSG
jgi:hypothetical protein